MSYRIRPVVKLSAHSGETACYARLLLSLMLCLSSGLMTAQVMASKCLFISSYHQGYAWADGVERGLRATLDKQCELKQFNMDTKRNKDEAFIVKQSLAAKAIIDSWQPDVVITADDNAAKYVIQKYYKDAATPFIFCGVNWTTEEYNFPYKNVTGVIEVAPINPLLQKVNELLPEAKQAVYIGANTPTELKNYERYKTETQRRSIKLSPMFADSTKQWLNAYNKAQHSDFIIIGSHAGISDWNNENVVQKIKPVSKKLSITSHEWMMPVSMLGFTKIAEEQGEMAGKMAISILNGTDISSIAIVPNRKWDIWTNNSLLKISGIDLGTGISLKAKQIH